MATTNYSKLTLAQLEREKAKIEQAIEARQGHEKNSLIEKITALASSSGFEIGELFDSANEPTRGSRGKKRTSKKSSGKRASAAKGRKVPPKFRNPDDPTQTWAGRGRQPRWYADRVNAGVDPKSLAA